MTDPQRARQSVLTLLHSGWHRPPAEPDLATRFLPGGGEWRIHDDPPLTFDDLLPPVPGGQVQGGQVQGGQVQGGHVPASPEPLAGTTLDNVEVIRAPVPSTCLATETGFAFHQRDGRLLVELSPMQLWAYAEFRSATTVRSAYLRHLAGTNEPMTEQEFAHLARQLTAVGLLLPRADTGGGAARLAAWEWDKAKLLDQRIDSGVIDRRNQRGDRPARPAVIPVSSAMRVVQIGTGVLSPNLALGLIFANAQAYRDGALLHRYDFEPLWVFRRRKVRRLLEEHGPSVFLFSNYVWSYAQNLELSALVKEMSPESITVHGGPNTPKYPVDCERFFAAYPHVDVAIRHEGEITTAELLDALDGGIAGRGGDLSMLRDVAGLSYRDGSAAGAVVRTPDRERIVELDTLPSPYLTGLFDHFAGIAEMAIIETNRGCPYGCTFCDWGSATLSRIRSFSTERVLQEIEWVAQHQMHIIALGDANFGMFARDVAITEHVAAMKAKYGYPQGFHASFAKNTAKYLKDIISILVDADIMTEGNLALQSNDPQVLAVVKRKNIRESEYVEVGARFREAQLPITTDLILGLPGSTPDTFAADLQFCVDHEVQARISRLELLVNSPMNDPEERRRLHVESSADPVVRGATERPLVVSTSTFTRTDLALMARWRDLFTFAENGGLLKHAVLWVHHVTGRPEMHIYRSLELISRTQERRFPLLSWACSHLIDVGAPPVSWTCFYDEVHRFLIEEANAPDDAALSTVLAVQLALAPERGRSFPHTVSLPHDYVAWYTLVRAARTQHGADWIAHVPPLASFAAAEFTVTDPDGVCETLDGRMVNADASNGLWELHSPVSRAQLAPYRHVFDAEGTPVIAASQAAS